MIYDWIYLWEKLNSLQPGLDISSEDDLLSMLGDSTVSYMSIPVAIKDLRRELSEHMRCDNVIFLFGNGASMYAGSRSTFDFKLERYAEGNAFAGVRQEIGKICSSVSGIEEQLNALVTIKSYFHIIKDTCKEKCVSVLIGRIKRDLIESFVNSINYTQLKCHIKLLEKLQSYGALPRTQIYTTNYDLAFEYALEQLGFDYMDGFSGFVSRRFEPGALSEKGRLSLVKIHGSVNWFKDEHTIKAIQPKFTRNGQLSVSGADPDLIYPASDKLYQTYSAPYSELMRHMLDEMETGSNVIMVLGYKYGDDHVNEILYKALGNQDNTFYFFFIWRNRRK